MIKPLSVLVIVVSAHSCAIDNIDGAEVIRIPIEDAAECQRAAEMIDAELRIRAYCEEGNTNDHE